MLPLSDRILLRLSKETMTARQLSRALDAEIAGVHHILRTLSAQGAAEEWEVAGQASVWRLVPGVRVAHRPESVVVTGTRPPGHRPRAGTACRAVSRTGRPCRMRAAAEGLCFIHAPRPDEPRG